MRDDDIPTITPALLLRAYASGVFPMAEDGTGAQIFWVDPKRRGILPLDGLHVSRRLARSFRKADFDIRVNTDFAGVLAGCADRHETWINAEIMHLYLDLHRLGHAHSIEIWRSGRLAGGVYGVALGGAFFGESMFSAERDASKFALIALVARLITGGFTLLDTQFVTDHLQRLGAIEISRAAYHQRLTAAINRPAHFWTLLPATPHQRVLQLINQTS